MVMKLYSFAGDFRAYKALIAAQYNGVKLVSLSGNLLLCSTWIRRSCEGRVLNYLLLKRKSHAN